MKGNASVYQVYPVSRITSEERAEVLRAWGPGWGGGGLENEGTGGGLGRGQLNLCTETANPIRGTNLTVVVEGMHHQFIMHIL